MRGPNFLNFVTVQDTVLAPSVAEVAWQRPAPKTIALLESVIPGPQLAVLYALAGIIRVVFPSSEQKEDARFHFLKLLLFGMDAPSPADLGDEGTERVKILVDLLVNLDRLPGIEKWGLRRDIPPADSSEAAALAAVPAPRLSDMGALGPFWTCRDCGTVFPEGDGCAVCREHSYSHRAKSDRVLGDLRLMARFLPAEAI